MVAIILFLLISFTIGAFILFSIRLIKGSKKKTFEQNRLNTKPIQKEQSLFEYGFMKDYRMWQKLSEEEKEIRLEDLDVLFKYGKEGFTKELIRNDFPIGTKIIDVSYFTGLTENGFTLPGFLVQHESGGEIREVNFYVRLNTMEFKITRNSYHSSGKERYYYLKNEELLKI